jgi:SAM-dependent methyltransferase
MNVPGYLYANGHSAALSRLQGLASIEDPATIAILTHLGDLSGWHCLEVGGGAGSIASWLAQRVGPMGRIDVTDIDPRFLEPLADGTIEVWRQDVVRDTLPHANFDLIHVRHVLLHLGEGVAAALDNLCQSLKPAGLLLIEESDFSGAGAIDSTPDALRATYTAGLTALLSLYRQRGLNIHLGAALPELLQQRALTVEPAQRRHRIVQGGSREAVFHRDTYAQARDAILNAGIAPADLVDAVIAAHRDNRLFYRSRQTVSVLAKRP